MPAPLLDVRNEVDEMAMVTGPAARDELRRRLFEHVPDGPTYGAGLPPGRTPEPVEGWLWSPPPDGPADLPPLADPASYDGPDDLLARSPQEALGNGSTAADRQRYCRAGADVTMRGGTTSGVVYPLAICEIARHFRLRNIGGASAGAIAAAAAAAAETGRAAVAPGDVGPAPAGRVRAGFAGLADVIAWLTALTPGPDPEPAEHHRLGRLFQPTTAGRALFRLVVAVMQRRRPWLPLLLLGAFGWPTFGVNAAILLGGAAVVASLTWWVRDLGTGVLAAGCVLLGIAAAVAAVVLRPRGRAPAAVPEQIVTPADRPRRDPVWFAVAVAVLVATFLLTPGMPVVALFLAGSLAVSVRRVLAGAGSGRFGLVGGSRPGHDEPVRSTGWWDGRAGLAAAEDDRPLLDWLADVLDDLAGLDGEPLRFGHLWFGRDRFRAGVGPAELTHALERTRARRVNLELITTELVHGVPYRFPLRHAEQYTAGRPQLFFRRADLCGAGGHTIPHRVVEAMIGASAPVTGRHAEDDAPLDGLYPLPDAWDLPVVFATRLSLALPGLFQAVRLYRRVPSAVLRDDFGRPVLADGQRLRHPRRDGGPDRFEELWFTDGGVTSNFPIHFFDSLLPLWPTFGINLGAHPTGFAHQDVWLPSDLGAAQPPARPVGPGMIGFLMSIFDTARGWRDATQAAMPAYRSRIAWVRQRSQEGGNNLFMDQDTIASLALRGALAGARLRRRFADDPHWHRHQWLRLRIAADNLESLRAQLSLTRDTGPLDELLSGDRAADTLDLLRKASDEGPGDPYRDHEWFTPDPAFWTEVRALTALRDAPAAHAVRHDVPAPAPEVRQVPPA